MNKMAKRLISLTLTFILLLSACAALTVNAEDIKIIDYKSLKVGQTANIGMTDPQSSAPLSVIWESSKPEVATVSSDGKVTGLSAGQCVVSALWNGKIYGVQVTVIASAAETKQIAPIAAKQNSTATEKLINYLKTKGQSSNGQYYSKWSNSKFRYWINYDSNSKKLDFSGVIRKEKDSDYGIISIYPYTDKNRVDTVFKWTKDARRNNIGEYKANSKKSGFNINNPVKLRYSSGKKTNNYTSLYKKYLKKFIPVWNKWLKSKLGLSLKKLGLAAVAKSKKIKLSKTSATLKPGKTLKLKLKNAKASKIKWKSSKKKVASVSKKGLVKAKKKGKTIITAKYKGKKYKCKITVTAKKTVKKAAKKTTAKTVSAFTKLKNYILNNGKKQSVAGGTLYNINWGDGYRLYYDNTTSEICFSKDVKTASTNAATSMHLNSNKTATVNHGVFGAEIGDCSASFRCSDVTSAFNIGLQPGKYNTIATIVSDTKNVLSALFPIWNSYIKSKAGVSLGQLGFVNWK